MRWSLRKRLKASAITLLISFGLWLLIGPFPIVPSAGSVRRRLEAEIPKGADDAVVKSVLTKDFKGYSWDATQRTYRATVRNTAIGVVLSSDVGIKVVMDVDGKVSQVEIRNINTGP